MNFQIAPHAGFCFGVKMAIQKGEELVKSGHVPIATLGPLIHNPQEVKRLESLGIYAKDSFEEIDEKIVLIRTHGVVYEEAEKRGLELYDCTCPFVNKVQKIAHEHSQNGYLVLILGNRNHPEVQGILGWAGNKGIAFQEITELKEAALKGCKVCLVALRKIQSVLPELYKLWSSTSWKNWRYSTPFVPLQGSDKALPWNWRERWI